MCAIIYQLRDQKTRNPCILSFNPIQKSFKKIINALQVLTEVLILEGAGVMTVYWIALHSVYNRLLLHN